MYDRTTVTELFPMDWSEHPTFAGVSVKRAHGDLSPAAFTQMLIQIDPHGGEIPAHAHDTLDECFVVLSGQGLALVEGKRVTVGGGFSIYAPAGREHGLRNDTDEPILLLASFVPAIAAAG